VPSSGNSPHHLGTFKVHPLLIAILRTRIRSI
jgi:hypothetical protein